MSEINANIVVEPFDITIQQVNPGITITPNVTSLNIFTAGYAAAGGNNTQLQYNKGGVLDGIPNTSYASGELSLGPASNVKITGGANAYFLQTDGTGNLTWAQGTANVSGNGTAAGANTQIQISDGTGNFTSAAGFVFDGAANLFETPGNANFAGNVTASYFIGNGAYLTGIDASKISNGNSNVQVYANANIAMTVNGNSNVVVVSESSVDFEGNINAGIGNLTSLNINDNITTDANFAFNGNGINITTNLGTQSYIQVANVPDNPLLTNTATIFSNVDYANGNVVYANIRDYYVNADGNTLLVATENLSTSNIDPAANSAYGVYTFYTYPDEQGNPATGSSYSIGNPGLAVTVGNSYPNQPIIAVTSYGNGGSESVGLRFTRRRGVGNARLSLQPNDYIANIQWRGAVSGGGTPTGNRFAKIGARVDSSYVANTAAQPVGLEFVVVNSTANITHSFYSNGVVSFASSIVANGNLTVNNANLGNLAAANYFSGNGSLLSNINGANVSNVANANYANYAGTAYSVAGANVSGQVANALIAGTVYTNAQPNITSVGNLTDLTVNGNITTTSIIGPVGGGANIDIAPDGAGHVNLNADTVRIGDNNNDAQIYTRGSGNLTLKTHDVQANESNITIVNGASGNIQLNPQGIVVTSSNIQANYFIGNGSSLTDITGGNVTGQVANALVAGTVYTNAQPNITSVGTLTDLRINNLNIHLGNGAGTTQTGNYNIAIGSNAGYSQSTESIAIGGNAGYIQGQGAIAIGGANTGNTQNFNAIAIGSGAVSNPGGLGTTQAQYGIAIGSEAAKYGQGQNSIAIGRQAGHSTSNTAAQPSNQIIINGTGTMLWGNTSNAFYVKPIRTGLSANTLLYYDATTSEVFYQTLTGYQGNIQGNNINSINNVSASGNMVAVGNVTAGKFMILSNNTAANLSSITGVAGAMIAVSDQDYQPAYWSVTDTRWKYVSNRANV